MSDCGCELEETAELERSTLWTLLMINGVMFIVEAIVGWWGDSAGVLADSLDMFADASVYGIALYAVGRHLRFKANAATVSGVLQIILGVAVFAEVVRRFFYGSDPVSMLMMMMGTIALVANVSCLMLISKYRNGDIHMRASWIFSANDVIANIGVVISGGLVLYLDNRLPDLVIGAFIAAVVLRGGVQILSEAKEARQKKTEV